MIKGELNMEKKDYLNQIQAIKGKTIGIIYVYEKLDSQAKRHYDAWEGDVLSNWIHAVYELHGLPLVMDVNTFTEKMTHHSLPPLDYVVNLCNGFFDLPSLGLVPSLCAYYSIPCIPCSSDLLLIGENKPLSNLIASTCGFRLPQQLSEESEKSITRPFYLGSSKGVYRGKKGARNINTFIQEFVPGFDTTVPVMFNPLDEELVVLPAVGYLPTNLDPNWFLGERQKETHSEYEKCIVSIDDYAKQAIIQMAKKVGITSYCRLDFRTKCIPRNEMKSRFSSEIGLEDLFFMEINPLPTIKDGINFFTGLAAVEPSSSIAKCLDLYRSSVREGSLTGFVLSNSIMSIKAMR